MKPSQLAAQHIMLTCLHISTRAHQHARSSPSHPHTYPTTKTKQQQRSDSPFFLDAGVRGAAHGIDAELQNKTQTVNQSIPETNEYPANNVSL